MSYDIDSIRSQFPALHQTVHGDQPLVYLDNAATTLKPQPVLDVLTHHYAEQSANIHRGLHTLSEQATAAYEAARETTRAFINAPDTRSIIFTSGTTASINLIARSWGRTNLSAGDEVIISHMEHHSNIVPWQMLRDTLGITLKVVPINDQGELEMDAYRDMLSDKTKLVSMLYVSNSLGTINPIKDVIDAAHEVGALTLVDAAQAVSNQTVDVQALDCDFLAFSGHKLFGPTGIGVLYGKEEHLEAMPPDSGGGDMILSVTFDKTTYNRLPYKFEAGTPHIAGVIGLGAAIEYVNTIGLPAIAAYEDELLAYATEKLSATNGVTLIGTAAKKTSILSFVLDDIHPHDIGSILDQHGVAIRAGHHCTQPVMQRFGVPATSRASLSMYNTREEVDTLVMAVKTVQEVFA